MTQTMTTEAREMANGPVVGTNVLTKRHADPLTVRPQTVVRTHPIHLIHLAHPHINTDKGIVKDQLNMLSLPSMMERLI
jgi:hypothetical protein